MAAAPPPLERAVALLQQRDGTDKALKAVRYGARLALALQAPGPGLDLGGETRHAQLRRLDRALGQSRKALRWGKFLGPVAELRRALAAAREKNTPLLSLYRLTDPAGGLAPAALAAEACYLFLDQAQFLVKAGLWRPSRRQRQVEVVAAAFEVLHLAARLGAAAARLRALLEREARLVLRLRGPLVKRLARSRPTAASASRNQLLDSLVIFITKKALPKRFFQRPRRRSGRGRRASAARRRADRRGRLGPHTLARRPTLPARAAGLRPSRAEGSACSPPGR